MGAGGIQEAGQHENREATVVIAMASPARAFCYLKQSGFVCPSVCATLAIGLRPLVTWRRRGLDLAVASFVPAAAPVLPTTLDRVIDVFRTLAMPGIVRWSHLAFWAATALRWASYYLRDTRCSSAQETQRVWPTIAGLRQLLQMPSSLRRFRCSARKVRWYSLRSWYVRVSVLGFVACSSSQSGWEPACWT